MTSPEETETVTARDTGKRLKNVGSKLLKYLSSVDKLLQLLDKLELVLSTVEQAPPKPVQESLVPSMKALISDELLRHADEDVKISVTSCITEITRITAPDVPYDDEQMKEIFKLTVAAFEKLSHVSGRCYEKALLILDNVARVRSCLVMLDLECDDLVIEMFQHFLRIIRSNHPHTAIRSMESIMTLVLDESEEISTDLLRPLLDSVRKENQTISPISGTLAEKVIANCAVKLKPYLMKAVESTGRALDEYAQIVTSICESRSESPQCDRSNGSKKTVVQVLAIENKLEVFKDADEQPYDVTKGLEPDMTCVRDVTQNMDDTKSNIRSAGASTMDGESIKKTSSKRKPHSELIKNSKRSNAKNKSETGNLESVRKPKSETDLKTVPKKRGRKPNSLMNPEEGYDHSWINMGRNTAKRAPSRKARDSSTGFPPSEKLTSKKDKLLLKAETASEALVSQPKNENIAKPAQSRKTCDIGTDFSSSASSKDNLLSKSENMSKGHEALVSQPKTDENTDATPPSTNHSIPDGSRPKRGRPRKSSSTVNQGVDPNSMSILKEDNLNPLLEETSLESPGVRLEKESEVRKDSEVKPQAAIRKIKLAVKIDGKTVMAPESVVAQMESKVSCEDREKPKNIEVANREDGRSSAQTEVKKRRRLNATPNKDHNKSPAIKELITEPASKKLSEVEETSQTRLRRRRTTDCVKTSDTRDFGNSLVGRRIKVWWPMDKKFYEGVIDSYDPVKGKHKILYVDGDVEVLNLKKQRWELTAVDVSPDEEQGIAFQKLEEASDIAQKGKGKSELESVKGANVDSQSRGRSSASISKSESVKSTVKSVDTSAFGRPGLVDESMDDPPRTYNGQDYAGKPKTKRMKTGSDIKKNKPETEDVQKERVQMT